MIYMEHILGATVYPKSLPGIFWDRRYFYIFKMLYYGTECKIQKIFYGFSFENNFKLTEKL